MRMTLAAVALFVVGLLGPATASATSKNALDALPTGLVPTTARLSQILALHAKIATTPTGAHDTIIEDWSYTDTGVSGTEYLERSGSDYHSRITAGTLVEQYGQLDHKRWHQDANGFTMNTSDLDDRSFIAIRSLSDAEDPKNDVRVVGQRTGPHPAYVVQVKRPGYAHPEWNFYDESTGNVVRVERVAGKSRIVATYDDFRTVDGVTTAWHIHDAYPDNVLDDDWRITSFQAGMPIPKSAFAKPASHALASIVTVRTALKAQITGHGYTILRLMVGNRGLDFELDSSSPTSYIDRNVAHDLGLPTFGHATNLSNGNALDYDTVLPDAQLGPIHLHNFALTATDMAYQSSESTRVVGVLGYDFLASNVLHIDYRHGLVEVFPPALFDGPKPVKDQIDLPLNLDDGVPFIPMIIGDGFTKRVMLDDDLYSTLVFGSFVNAHRAAFQDLEAGHHRQGYVPFADQSSYGVKADIWWSQTPRLRFAIANYKYLPILTTNFSYERSGRTVDAVLGLDYLHYFDLYFDFPHDRMIVVPNAWFYKSFTKNAH